MFKKKLLSVVAAASMLSSIFAFGFPSLATETAIANDFEVHYEGWTTDFDTLTALEARDGYGVGGSRGMKVSNRQNPEDGALSDKGFYLWGGETYDYSVFVRHEEQLPETFVVTLSWEYYDGAKTGETESAVLVTQAVQGGEWTKLGGKYKTPALTHNITVKITTESTADFVFDDFAATQTTLKPRFSATANAPANPGLKDIYANHFRVGNIFNGTTVQNSNIQALILREYNSITAENEHKPNDTMNRSASSNTNIVAQFNTGAARINDFCARNNIPIRDHTLSWHGQTPDWFFLSNINDTTSYRTAAVTNVNSVPWASTTVMNQRLESYIKSKFDLYASSYPNLVIYAVDVVNEFVLVDAQDNHRAKPRHPGFDGEGAGGHGAAPGASPWSAIYGNQTTNITWVRNAFTYARRHAPAHTKLFYNDYNEFDPTKRTYIINNILRPLHEEGILDGMGMQGHLDADQGGWSSWERFRNAMDDYSNVQTSRGYIDVQITELDVSRGYNSETGRFSFTEEQQATKYRQIFEHAIAVNARGRGKFTAICIWTVNDGHSWIRANQPALHDANNNPKPAYNAVAGVVPRSEWGDGNNPGFDVGNNNTGPLEPNEWGWYFHDTFEGTADPARLYEWTPRGGNTTVASTATLPLLGSRSLSVRERGAAWHGAQKPLNPRAFSAGREYSFSVCVVYTSSSGAATETFALTLEYTNAAGELSWATIDTKTTARNNWVQLHNPNFMIPAGATNCSLIVETRNDSTVAFYMDEAIGAVGGVGILAPDGVSPPVDNTGDHNSLFAGITLTQSYKAETDNNPLITQRFTADPGYMVYNGRVYIYTTNDVVERDSQGNVTENTYGQITTINCISSADLVNWTDHGAIQVAGSGGAARWAHQSWAPSAAWKHIDGQDKFFLYFSNNATSIGVLTADSPTGPWTDPRGNALVTRGTAGVGEEVLWCFDPAILIDDDGQAYLYFGGGVPEGQSANPQTARVIRLGDDMISTVGEAVTIDNPYHFEAAGINKIGDTYYFSYCSNFDTNFEQTGFRGGTIYYMTSDDPMTGFTNAREVLRNPNDFFPNNGGNNHHSIVEFKGDLYVFYHTRQLQNAMGLTGNYRSTHVDRLEMNGAEFRSGTMTMTGVSQLEPLNPYATVRASTIARQGGIAVRGVGDTIVTDIQRGDWLGVKGAAFTHGAASVSARVSSANGGVIKVCAGSPAGEAVAYIEVPATNGNFVEVTAPVSGLSGMQDVYFVFSAEMEFESWHFSSGKTGLELNVVSIGGNDWIEVINPTSAAVSVRGMYLTDDEGNRYKWGCPSAIIGAGETVRFSGEGITPELKLTEVNFRTETAQRLWLNDFTGSIVAEWRRS